MAEIKLSERALQAEVLNVGKKLKSFGISFEQWGVGSAKTVGHLAREILEGETKLVVKKKEIVRRIELVHLDVRYSDKGVELQLAEDRQEFKDGRVRRRGLLGLSEKMKPGENPLATAERALAEELGVNSDNHIDDIGIEEIMQASPSYPGLKTEYLIHNMQTNLHSSAFKPQGYIERQPDKSTFFIWQEVQIQR